MSDIPNMLPQNLTYGLSCPLKRVVFFLTHSSLHTTGLNSPEKKKKKKIFCAINYLWSLQLSNVEPRNGYLWPLESDKSIICCLPPTQYISAKIAVWPNSPTHHSVVRSQFANCVHLARNFRHRIVSHSEF